jgi:hypothetical protein
MAFPSRSRIEKLLRTRTDAARENLHRKRAKFDALVEAIQEGVARDCDGAQRVRDAGSELAAARQALINAVSEFHEYLKTGIVPERFRRME